MLNETLIWTAIPNGVGAQPNTLKLSVFLSPQLSTGGGNAPLSDFPDFSNWPQWISGRPGGPISFDVVFENGATAEGIFDPNMPTLAPAAWNLMFNSGVGTNVADYGYKDMSKLPTQSFSSKAALEYIQGTYATVGFNSAVSPPVLTWNGTSKPEPPRGSLLKTILNELTGIDYTPGLAIDEAVGYYHRLSPGVGDIYIPEPKALDFHQAISGLGSYPYILRMFGLVFDLIIQIPESLGNGSSTVKAVPSWTSSFTGSNGSTINVSLPTACTIESGVFQTALLPNGTGDYANGMLNLADSSRFSITSLDVDGASQRMASLTSAMFSVLQFQSELGSVVAGQSIAVPLPALRSTGPVVVYSEFAKALNTLMARQTTISAAVEKYVTSAHPNPASLPTLYASDVVRGHRFDVYTASDPSPAWLSLHERYGSYSFGPNAGPNPPSSALPLSHPDEGFTSHAASQVVGVANPPPDLYIHEEIARWRGWSLSAPRYGAALDPSDAVADNAGNPADSTPDGDGKVSPQFSASFSVPTTGPVIPNAVPAVEQVATATLPKLRFGNQYQFRARGVDLAGNGPSVMSSDASTATPAFTHYRYQPVAAPILAATASYTPGQAVLVMAILNDMVDTPQPNGRWLFAPKVSQLLAEEHGMFDVQTVGLTPSPGLPPSGSQATYDAIRQMDGGSIALLPGATPDENWNSYYFPLANVSQLTTPWMADPISQGVTFVGLPGTGAETPTPIAWEGGPWPSFQPFLLELQPGATGATPTSVYHAATANSSAIETVTLPPGAVYDVRISSLLFGPNSAHPTWPSFADLGVWQWIIPQVPAADQELFYALAELGLIWMLSPYVTLRMVHATRQPVFPPTFEKLTMVSPRPYGSTTANLYDPSFAVDAESTSSVSVEANWTDFVDIPGDILNVPGTSTITTQGPAFEVTVPDPAPQGAVDNPGLVAHAPQKLALFESPGLTHDIGDTKHHLVDYTAVGTSRFAEFFRPARPLSETLFTDTSPVVISPEFGINPGSVIMTDESNAVLDPSQYDVDEVHGTISLVTSPAHPIKYTVDYEPIVTLPGPDDVIKLAPVHILSSARPAAPKVDRVMPAWQLLSEGSVSSGELVYGRAGGWLRVWLERPWYSSGNNELLGVVTLPRQLTSTQPPADPGAHLATIVGLDPISVADPSLTVMTTPQKFQGLATLPTGIVGRPAYPNPPRLGLLEDKSNTAYNVYPFEVNYDPTDQQWYADVRLEWPYGQEPPPGYFVRLGIVRFQPYSCVGAEVSPVALATFTQPVPNRAVSVVNVPEQQSVKVTVEGAAYQGFRPAYPEGSVDNGETVYDVDNSFALQPYSYGGGEPATSAMVVEIQVQNTSTGLSGDLAWQATGTPVLLNPTFQGANAIWAGSIELPFPVGGGEFAQRIRLSELDYYTAEGAPITVDTTLRRPFVAHIPIQ